MLINDVLRLVVNYYPSEYDLYEMYIWCNEVSSMLLIEDRHIFKSVVLYKSSDGSYLLPENVDVENIEYITLNNRVLNKQDFRSFGCFKTYYKGLNGIVIYNSQSASDSIKVDYLVPYQPIRLPKYSGSVTIDKHNDSFSLPKCEFVQGDILVFRFDFPDSVAVSDSGETSDSVAAPDSDTNDELVLSDVPLLNICYDSDSKQYVCDVALGTFSDSELEFPDSALITRVVTDKTVCDAPFDSMYVDYLLAKICFFQRDINAYNQHMTSFNSRLAAYRNWLVRRMPNDDCVIKNWW